VGLVRFLVVGVAEVSGEGELLLQRGRGGDGQRAFLGREGRYLPVVEGRWLGLQGICGYHLSSLLGGASQPGAWSDSRCCRNSCRELFITPKSASRRATSAGEGCFWVGWSSVMEGMRRVRYMGSLLSCWICSMIPILLSGGGWPKR